MPEPTLITKQKRAGPDRRRRGVRIPAWIPALASLRITGVGLLLLGVGSLATSPQGDTGPWLIIAPLLLLALNLGAALLSNPLFRLRPALFGMHVGLLLLAVALAYGQLTRFRGHIEITEGQAFDPGQVIVDRQPLLTLALPEEGAFTQGTVRINYAPGTMRRETLSRVELDNGQASAARDGRPLIIDGHRFYVTHNKGFSALISWWPDQASSPRLGSLHFPSYPRLAPTQSLSWTVPGGTALNLEIRPKSIPQEKSWTLSGSMAEALLLVRLNGKTRTLHPGERMRLPGGTFRFEAIRMWIGYRIFYDPSLYLCFSSALIVVCCLAIHLAGRHLRKPKRTITLTDTGKVTT
ncbi:MAG: hypothetical protein AB2723_16955 [Candidatus Thiodiazotropha sp.]